MSDPLDGLPSTARRIVRGAMYGNLAYVVWGVLHDVELERARAAMADLVAAQDVRHDAAMRRNEKLRTIGSEATFFSGLARIGDQFRSVRAAVTPADFVLLDNWIHLDPESELARFPRQNVTDAVIVDENGDEVRDQLIDPLRELETQQDRYAVVLKRHDADGALPPVSFLFRSGEPARECRNRYRAFARSGRGGNPASPRELPPFW